MTKIRLHNKTRKAMQLDVEPYAFTYDLDIGDTVEVVGELELKDGFIDIELFLESGGVAVAISDYGSDYPDVTRNGVNVPPSGS